ncbi:MAG: hypothetical protein M0R77_18275 [Gammaproteobacteria bacterium]|nr:hypothetical protein [Gammaproteobacteria bacterium]
MEALNKAILAFSAHGEQKAWFLLAFTTTACVEENGGTSMCRGKRRLNQRFLIVFFCGHSDRNFPRG